MKNFTTHFVSRLHQKQSLLRNVFLAFIGLLFGILSSFGLSNCSISANEAKVARIQTEYGNNIHIRYHLSEESEARRQSLVSPINQFNSNRIQEIGRNASFVLEKSFFIQCESKELDCNFLVYSDFYSEYYTLSRFGLFQGKYVRSEFNEDNTVYISRTIANYFGGSSLASLLEKTITLSFDEKEYVIKGIIDEQNNYDSPIHFSKLFGDKYIVFNTYHFSDYGYSDILFESDDETFVGDSTDLISAFKQSYVNFYQTVQSVSSCKNNNLICSLGVVFTNPINIGGIMLSVVVLVLCIICSLVFSVIQFMNAKEKYIPAKFYFVFFLNIVWCSLPLLITTICFFINIYMSKASIVAAILFLLISLIATLVSFLREKSKVENNNA